MSQDWSNWHFFDEADVMDKTISQLVSTVADVVLSEVHSDMHFDLCPAFDFDDLRRDTQTVYLSVWALDVEARSLPIEDVAIDAACNDVDRARFISSALRRAADKLDEAFPTA